jgi:hypothetical protein
MYFIPFTHQPVATGRKTAGETYTVPAGYYARVSIFLSASSSVLAGTSFTPINAISISNASDSCEKTLWVNAGDAVALAATAANQVTQSNALGVFANQSGSTASATLNSNTIAAITPVASFVAYGGAAGPTVTVATIGGNASAYLTYEEYAEIS